MINRLLFRWLLLLLPLTGIVVALLNRDSIDINDVQTQINNLGIYAPMLFIGLYFIATLLFFPGSLLTLAGGALFGLWLGTVYNLTDATLGATLVFLASRYIGSAWVQRKANGMLQRLLKLRAGVSSLLSDWFRCSRRFCFYLAGTHRE